MATVSSALVPPRWRRLPLRSARLRLALLYSGMFLALGTALVAIISLVGSTGAIGSSSAVAVHPVPGGTAGIHAAVFQQHSADVSRLLAGAWLTLLLTAVVSAPLGWFLAGRVLRPLRDMTLTAQTISAGNLHERIGLHGPDDEFKQLGDTIDDLLARLEASFGAQRRFIANAAHELRTPLTVERALLQVALSDPDASAASLRETCEELLDAGRDHERLLDSLLTLATGQRGLESRKPLDLTAIVQHVLGAHCSELEQASLSLDSQLGAASTSGDHALVERLAANLLENAIHYNQPGGHIAVSTALDAGRATLVITNTGPVVRPEEVERLFEPFRRLGNDRAAAAGHHGLGLSIVRAIATTHGAEVTATPQPEGGLAVMVSFPLAP